MTITYKDEAGAAGMRLAGRLASEVLDYLTPHVKAWCDHQRLGQARA